MTDSMAIAKAGTGMKTVTISHDELKEKVSS